MRTVIHIWLLLSLLSANNNLDYVFEYFINGIPSDDPIEYKIDSNINYVPRLDTSLYWIVPNKELPADVNTLKSNNNIAIEFFQNRIFIAFRSSSSNFANLKRILFDISIDYNLCTVLNTIQIIE